MQQLASVRVQVQAWVPALAQVQRPASVQVQARQQASVRVQQVRVQLQQVRVRVHRLMHRQLQ
jgi:hypothetical protein